MYFELRPYISHIVTIAGNYLKAVEKMLMFGYIYHEERHLFAYQPQFLKINPLAI
jgi:hypothetical protein